MMERAICPARTRTRQEARSLGRVILTILIEIREVESRVPLRGRAGRRAQAAAAVWVEGRQGAGAVVLELAPDFFGLGQAFAAQAGDVEDVVVCGCGGSGLVVGGGGFFVEESGFLVAVGDDSGVCFGPLIVYHAQAWCQRVLGDGLTGHRIAVEAP